MIRPIMMASMLAITAFPALARTGDAAPAIRMSPALDKLLAGKTPGEPVSCINLPQVRDSTTLRDPDTLLYRSADGVTYVNQPASGCGFRGDEIIVSRTPSTRLCTGDIIVGVDRGSRIPTASCGLGPFIPYRGAKRSDR